MYKRVRPSFVKQAQSKAKPNAPAAATIPATRAPGLSVGADPGTDIVMTDVEVVDVEVMVFEGGGTTVVEVDVVAASSMIVDIKSVIVVDVVGIDVVDVDVSVYEIVSSTVESCARSSATMDSLASMTLT